MLIIYFYYRPLPNNNRRVTSTSAPINAKNRPRICQRLIINCASNPEHRCCQYQVENTVVVVETTTEAVPVSTTSVRKPQPPRKIPIVPNSVVKPPSIVKGMSAVCFDSDKYLVSCLLILFAIRLQATVSYFLQ